MVKNIFLFIKNTYKIILVFIFIAFFFSFYNTYLVDRSLLNLRVALSEAAQAKTVGDFEKIKPLLQVTILRELSGKISSTETLILMEIAQDISSSAKYVEQVTDIKFYLIDLLKKKEEKRGGILSILDRINANIFAATNKLSEKKLKAREKGLIDRINFIKDKKLLQEAYFDLGNTYIQLSDIEKAKDAFVKTIELNPKNDVAIRARFNLGWAYKLANKYDESIACFEELIKEFPSNDLAIAGEFLAAFVLYKKGEYEKARDRFSMFADEHRKAGLSKFALFQAGYISLYNLNDKESALSYFAKLESRFSGTAIAKHADVKTREAIAADFRREGYKLLTEKKYNEAIENFKKAVEVIPRDGKSYSGIGLSYQGLAKTTEALDNTRKAVKLSFREEMVLTNSLYVYITTGNIDEAIQTGEEAMNRASLRMAEFYYNLGCAYIFKKEYNKAVSMFKNAIKRKPYFTFTCNNLGYTLWANNDYSEAIIKFRAAINIEPNYMKPHFNLGVIYLSLNQLEDSYKEFKIVLDLKSQHKDADSVHYKQAETYLSRIEDILQYKPY